MQMNNQIVVITGAGSGIGRALAHEYARLGARLALNDCDAGDLDESRQQLEAAGYTDVLTEVFDVSEKDAMQAFAARVRTEMGNAHTIVNNAGIAGMDEPAYNIKDADFRRVMDINFYGVLNGCTAFLPQLVEENRGHVINISSVFGLVGIPNCADYCASKFAVRGYTESLVIEFHDSPIGIHCVHPGGIATRIARNANNQEFNKFLQTRPEDMARRIIRDAAKGKPKIVYGNQSFRLWLGSTLIPQRLQNWLTWQESKGVLDLEPYRSFIK